MQIPKSFNLFGQVITVEYRKSMFKTHKACGLWIPTENKILLQESTKYYPTTQLQIEQTFIHEAIHACLELLGYTDLNADEKLVDNLAALLHQMLSTQKY